MSQVFNLGNVRGPQGEPGQGFRYMGQWIAQANVYARNDVVLHNNALWIALTDTVTSATQPSASGQWQLFLPQGPQGQTGNEGPPGETGDRGPQGPAGPNNVSSWDTGFEFPGGSVFSAAIFHTARFLIIAGLGSVMVDGQTLTDVVRLEISISRPHGDYSMLVIQNTATPPRYFSRLPFASIVTSTGIGWQGSVTVMFS